MTKKIFQKWREWWRKKVKMGKWLETNHYTTALVQRDRMAMVMGSCEYHPEHHGKLIESSTADDRDLTNTHNKVTISDMKHHAR